MPKISINSKLPNLKQTIFTTMTQLANAHQAINLGQGFPDFEMSEKLQNLVTHAMKNGWNQYAHTFGFQGLREIICDKIESLYGTQINPEKEITITPGGTYALSNTFTALLREGDEVIVFEPCFDSYCPNIELMGGVPICIPLNFPDYSIPWEKVRAAFTEKTRFILINSPHNPSGAVLGPDDIENLRSVVADSNCLILSDEVYEHLIFDGNEHHSILRYPDLLERSFVAFSLGKVFHCTGWKIGYCIAPDYLMQEFRNHHQFNVFSVNTPAQVGIAQYLENPSVYLDLPAIFQKKRDLLLDLTNGLPLDPIPSYGSYFQCFTYDETLAKSDSEMAIRLVKEFGVATIPVSAFYREGTDNQVLRFCFAKKDDTLIEAAKRLQKLKA